MFLKLNGFLINRLKYNFVKKGLVILMDLNPRQTYKERFLSWLESDKLNEKDKSELKSIESDDEEIKERFSEYLSFGTAGLRGIMAMGTHNMNIYTVCHATQGFADYLNAGGITDAANRGIVIAYDSRINSKVFAQSAAAVMANNGIKVYLFDDIRPTPELSYAIRTLGAAAGINITASHNPKEYNGYKAYSEDGAQLSPEQADEVSKKNMAANIFSDVKFNNGDFETAVKNGKINIIGSSIDEGFLSCVLNQSICPEIVSEAADKLIIVYTPLYGAGYKLVPEAMRRLGVRHIYTVDEQMTPDGNFPSTPFPNPELPQVFELAVKLANERGADIIIANDPDADRTGVMIRNDKGEFITLTGNQIGAMLLDYIIQAEKEFGKLSVEAFAVKTIVSTDIVTKICKVHGVKLYDVLTGFKFIGKVVSDREAELGRTVDKDYLLGFEESNGYNRGTYVRDKDAVCATVMLCEMAAYYQTHGKSVYEALCDMYSRYGLYKEHTSNIYMEGIDGAERMKKLMSKLRSCPPEKIGEEKVRFIRDYLDETITDTETGSKSGTHLPKSNVLFYEMESGNKVIVRPSGTEPKIKIYYLLHSDSNNESELENTLEMYTDSVKKLMKI